MKNKLFNLVVRATAVATVASSLAMVAPARGANLESVSDTLSRLKINTSANHAIEFVIATALGDTSDAIVITFPASFDTSTIVFGDVDLAYSDSSACSQFPNELTLAGSAGDNAWGADMTSDVLILTHPTNGANGDIAANRCVEVQIGTNASGGSNQIINGSSGAQEITITTAADSGILEVYLVDDDQVTVSAVVDQELTFDIDTSTSSGADTAAPYTVDFGTLTTSGRFSGTGNVEYIMFDLDTNGTQGAVITILNANGTSGMVSASEPTESIANSTGSMSSGVENYGWCVLSVTQTSGATLTRAGGYSSYTCNGALADTTEALSSTTPETFLTVSGPVAGARGVLSGSAATSVLTEAHDDYSDTLTFVATATF
jgi:hypothetical protein